jgi:hypothetical protein
MATKIVDIRLRANDPARGNHWRDARGHVKDAWQGKIALHRPLANGEGQQNTKREWCVSHLPSGYRILGTAAILAMPTKAQAEAAIDYACKAVIGWVLAMEFDHHTVEGGRFDSGDLRMFRDTLKDHLLHGFIPPPPPELAEVHAQMFGAASTYVDCDAGCGYSTAVEPDAWYKCPECGKGMIKSPIERLIREVG